MHEGRRLWIAGRWHNALARVDGEWRIARNPARRSTSSATARPCSPDGATGIWINLEQTANRLRFEVRDNGSGFEPSRADGHGLRNMRDRIEAVEGQLAIESQPGHGTRITGSVPLP